MEINEKLYVSADAFFDKLAESVAYDISSATGKKVRPKQVSKGYSYTKKLKNKVGRKGGVKVTITDFEAPKIYAAKFETNQGVNFISYKIEPMDNGIGVTYSEGFEGGSAAKTLNYKIMSFFYSRGSKKKAQRLLRAIEKFIKDEEAQGPVVSDVEVDAIDTQAEE